MATLQEPSHGKQKEGSSGPVKKTIALKLKNSKKEEGNRWERAGVEKKSHGT